MLAKVSRGEHHCAGITQRGDLATLRARWAPRPDKARQTHAAPSPRGITTQHHSQGRSHRAELFKSDVGRGTRLVDADEFAAEREEVVQLVLGGLGREASDVDSVSRSDSGGHCGCVLELGEGM